MEGPAAWTQITAVSRDNAGEALMERGEWLQRTSGVLEGGWDFGVDLRLRDTVTEMPGHKIGQGGAAAVHKTQWQCPVAPATASVATTHGIWTAAPPYDRLFQEMVYFLII